MAMSSLRLWWRYFTNETSWTAVLVAVLLLGAMLFAGIGGQVRAAFERARFTEAGLPTTAEVVAKLDGKRGPWLRYRYQDAEARTFVARDWVPRSYWNRISVGDIVKIDYLGHEPKTSRVQPAEFGDASNVPLDLLCTAVLCVPILIVGWFIVVRPMRTAWRQMRIVRNGLPVLGRVTEVCADPPVRGLAGNRRSRRKRRQAPTPEAADAKPDGKAPSSSARYLKYAFLDSDGREWTDESPNLPSDLANRWRRGDSILVLYMPGDPSRNEPDVFAARTDGPRDVY